MGTIADAHASRTRHHVSVYEVNPMKKFIFGAVAAFVAVSSFAPAANAEVIVSV